MTVQSLATMEFLDIRGYPWQSMDATLLNLRTPCAKPFRPPDVGEGVPNDITRVRARVAAPASRVYGILRDYRTHHPNILPKPPFVGLAVVEGGVGAGTVIDVSVRMVGGTQVLRMVVSEPEPGRVLAESAVDGAVTRFVVEPVETSSCDVTIETRWPTKRLLRNLMVAPAYRKELRLLDAYARTLA
jgi:hypothetical protein